MDHLFIIGTNSFNRYKSSHNSSWEQALYNYQLLKKKQVKKATPDLILLEIQLVG
jgi:hypothetical protein